MLKEGKKKVILIILAIVLIFICCYTYNVSNKRIFSLSLINEDKYQEIISNHEKKNLNVNVYFDNKKIDLYEDSYYLISQKDNQKYNGALSINKDKYNMVIVDPNDTKDNIMVNNNTLKLIIYNDKSYDERYIHLTLLPVLTISDSELIEESNSGKHLYSSSMTINNYDETTSLFDSEDYYITYHARGNSSYNYSNKKSYKVNLKDKKGNNKKESLLGMRKDDDWILMSLTTDKSKIKEVFSYDIWRQLEPNYSINLQYVELIKDNQYQGIYALAERVDSKTFGGKKDDIFIKVNDWNVSDVVIGDSSEVISYFKFYEEKNECKFSEFEFNNCNLKKFYEYYNIALAIKYIDVENVGLLQYDWDNCVDYQLYLNMCGAVDSPYKNQRLYLKENDDGTFLVFKTVWDTDWNFQDDQAEEIWPDQIIPASYSQDEQFLIDQANEYFAISDYYNSDNLVNEIEEYFYYLHNSGAYLRDESVWGEETYIIGSSDYVTAVQNLENTVIEKVNYLNDYYKNILDTYKGE